MKQRENHAVLKSRFLDALDCRVTDRVAFVPAIYEHKGWFVGATPSQVSRDLELLTQAVLTEYDHVRADALVVGVDVSIQRIFSRSGQTMFTKLLFAYLRKAGDIPVSFWARA
ncbi:MAG: hypothetical protein HY563_05210 [Ignavibacteriales bacterium]|nr:hypothetical protein [Ignavibacteriales bacterium]